MQYFITTILLLFSLSIQAQVTQEVTADKPVEIDGVQYGYFITNESTKEAGGKEMSRYEITLYAKNVNNCAKIFLFENRSMFSDNTTAKDDLARFICRNATGQRLTSKGGNVKCTPFFANAKVEIKDCSTNKTNIEDKRVQFGYVLKSNQTVTNSIIVIVPLGEKPAIQVMPLYSSTSL